VSEIRHALEGYLHIGHAKSICLNFGLAKEYGGVCRMRFDDTNPNKENIEYVHAILSDVTWLMSSSSWVRFVRAACNTTPSIGKAQHPWDGEVRHTSDYFSILFESARYLINQVRSTSP
jgi:glutaminyl-tRNA synthetase